jgi:hypothetical protein
MTRTSSFGKRLLHRLAALLGIIAFVAFGVELQNWFGLPFDTTYRITCAGACLAFIAKLGWDSPGERWPWIGLGLAAIVNIALFFMPILDRPASRGEVMIFAMPDLVVVMAARIRAYRVTNDHQRAVRQQLVVGWLLALAICALVIASALVPDRPRHRGQAANSLNAAATVRSG